MPDVSNLPKRPPVSSTPERFDDGVYLHALEALQPDDAAVGRHWQRWAWGVALALVLLALPFIYMRATEKPKHAPQLTLSISPAGSDLLIAWAGGVPRSRSSKLKVRDETHEEEFDLRPSYEIAGTLVYHPKSTHVHVIWSLDSGGRFYGKEADYQVRAAAVPADSAAFARAPRVSVMEPKSAAPARRAATSQSKGEIERLQAHNRRMEALVKALRARENAQ